MDQWLVRTAKNVLSGPYTRDRIRQLIQDGKLTPQDEVCQANHYWIFLHENEEVLSQLGVEMPRTASDEEVTETETVRVPRGGNGDYDDDDLEDYPELSELPEGVEENTAVLSNRALREFRPRRGGKANPAASNTGSAMTARGPIQIRRNANFYAAQILGHIERPSIWRGFAWILVAAIVGLVAWVIFVLRTTG